MCMLYDILYTKELNRYSLNDSGDIHADKIAEYDFKDRILDIQSTIGKNWGKTNSVVEFIDIFSNSIRLTCENHCIYSGEPSI